MATIKMKLEGKLLAQVKTAKTSKITATAGEEARFSTKQEAFFGTHNGAGVYNCLGTINRVIGGLV